MNIALDASMALSWLFGRQKPGEQGIADAALDNLSRAEAFVPLLWHTEIANALLVAERRKLVTEAIVIDYLERLAALPIEEDNLPPLLRRDQVMSLARRYDLTAYDAIYLELALRKGAALATFDARLAAAMRAAGGQVFE
ncbi:MAG: type II toxin-antitoxin system VapC family toxin [Azoarcus sp.]|jgi:predicted nucleic acid-binding protein|nr:type II toxin-antitoxin system VapC family toxin [Azoarcus sp.]